MSNLTTEQLAELTERINARLAEFKNSLMPRLDSGVVRLAYDVIEEWECTGFPLGPEPPVPAAKAKPEVRDEPRSAIGADAPTVNGYVAGYAQGWRDSFEEMMRQAGDGDDDGDPNMSEETADAIRELADAAVKHLEAKEADADPPPKSDEKLTSVEPAPISSQAAATLGPEHTSIPAPTGADLIVTPLVPRKPLTLDQVNADTHRERLATALATGSEALVEKVFESTKKGPTRKGEDPTLNEVIVRLQRMAMGGRMPSMSTWDEAKPVGWPVATTLCSRLEMGWQELAGEAGLTPNARGARN